MIRNEKQSLFEQFSGADLDRLAECLKAIRKNGLETSPYTQAGINQNSGNVWVWDEYWVGCVYCSISFDVKWSWSCGQCGKEYDFDTYSEMDDFVSRQNDLTDCNGCEQCCEVSDETYDEFLQRRLKGQTISRKEYLALILSLLRPDEIRLSAANPTQYMTKTHVLLHYVALRRLGVNP